MGAGYSCSDASNKVGFINGTFDVLHPGHIHLISFAATYCSRLVVAIDSDERVKQLKGKDRPFFNQYERKLMLESIRYVSHVDIFNTDNELRHLVDFYEPDVMVIGSDWEGKEVIGSEYAGRIEFFPRFGDYSTTKILQGLANR
jgi:D-beta-D-heptose 7-phosphate kinase/D-beta-D-heptose 1-phosphate adenosyltransferase